MVISTRNLEELPDIKPLRRLSQSIAMLDAIIEPEWQFRYYYFNAHWAEGEMMGSMRDGSGDDYFILFSRSGAIIIGDAHESILASYVDGGRPHWPGMLDQVPPALADALAEPAFDIGATSFCIWRLRDAPAWSIGAITFPAAEPAQDDDGSAELLSILDGDPRTYRTWAEEYYERDVSLETVERIYRHEPLTKEIIATLNEEMTLDMLREDCREIGYPIADGEGG